MLHAGGCSYFELTDNQWNRFSDFCGYIRSVSCASRSSNNDANDLVLICPIELRGLRTLEPMPERLEELI